MRLFLLLLLLPFANFAQENEKIYDFVEVEPEYPGGMEAMQQFLIENIEYPQAAVDNGEQGVVYIQFVVGKTGEIRDAQIKRGVSALLDAEALRVINAMPKWIPGQQGGEPINVRFTLPINFTLGNSAVPEKAMTKKEKRALKKKEKSELTKEERKTKKEMKKLLK